MNRHLVADWRANFFAGLAIVLPAVISCGIIYWLFGTVSNFTDILLVLVPAKWKYVNQINGDIHWYWSLFALAVAGVLISLIGRLARNYLGRRIIRLADQVLLQVPLLNKIYGTIKQVNEAFSSGNKSSFKQVVLLEFPRAGHYSLGFITGSQHNEVQSKTKGNVVSVFVPTTPNPTSGFLVMVPESEITKLEMSVADGIKFIISLGSISPEFTIAKREKGS